MGKRLKVFFHDNCFDGAASAAVFADFYRQRIDAAAEVVFEGVQHQAGDPFAGRVLDGDDNACVDFRFCPAPAMTWWFDHHASAFQPPALEAVFRADASGQKFYDPAAPSNTRFQVETLTRERGYQLPAVMEDLVHWAHIIDSAAFASPAMAVELAEPALRIMTWLEANRDPALTARYIEAVGQRSLDQIAAEAWIAEPLAPILAAHQRAIALIGERAAYRDGVVFFDLTGDEVAGFNKFISYFHYPDATYTLGVTAGADRVKISVGANPWAPEKRRHDISVICQRYGGGGHPVVGAVSLPPDQVERGRAVAAEILAELSS